MLRKARQAKLIELCRFFSKNKLNNSSEHVSVKTVGDAVKFLGSAILYFTAHRGALSTNVSFLAVGCDDAV